ncbi:hypothetical protein D3C76_1753880 [compost metagenome]|jgi:hypothetical protein
MMNLIEAVESGHEQGFKVVFNANFINSSNNDVQNVKVRYYEGRSKKEDFVIQDTMENIISQQIYLISKKNS